MAWAQDLTPLVSEVASAVAVVYNDGMLRAPKKQHAHLHVALARVGKIVGSSPRYRDAFHQGPVAPNGRDITRSRVLERLKKVAYPVGTSTLQRPYVAKVIRHDQD